MRNFLFISLVLMLSTFLSACNQTAKKTDGNQSDAEPIDFPLSTSIFR